MAGSPLTIHLPRPEDTEVLGEELGRRLFGGAVAALTGPLGAGKTTLVRGMARGLGIDADYLVSSPTFTILQTYPCRALTLCHLDLYRVSGHADAESTGYRDLLGREDAVLVVEWAEKEPEMLPPERLEVVMRYQGKGRVAMVKGTGDGFRAAMEAAARLAARRPGGHPRGRVA